MSTPPGPNDAAPPATTLDGGTASPILSRSEQALEAARLHREASAEETAGNLGAAREKFHEALKWRRALGDRGREAATWLRLAQIGLKEGDPAGSSEALRRCLELAHAVGDRDTEAAALHEVGFLAWKKGKRPTGLLLVAISFSLLPPQGAANEETAMTHMAHMAAAMGYGLDKLNTVLSEAVAEYEHDGGRTLIEEALSEAPENTQPLFPG
jgi:tetratricopeptide (TPR) repeat protein